MSQISAADNHVILTKNGKWRLIQQERPLAEASPKGFRYSGRFGTTRRLPEAGIIHQDDVQQVVLGWQQTDESWHLGLILAPSLAEQRGSRWCEIVYWPDPEISVFQDLAQQSGQELAQSMGVPFYVIPPQALEPAAPPRELPPMPLRFGDWRMEATSTKDRYIIKRSIFLCAATDVACLVVFILGGYLFGIIFSDIARQYCPSEYGNLITKPTNFALSWAWDGGIFSACSALSNHYDANEC